LDRNTFLAVALSLAVLVAWTMYQGQLAPPPGETGSSEVAETAEAPGSASAAVEPAPAAQPLSEPEPIPVAPADSAEERRISFEKPLYIAEFSSRGAGLVRWELRDYYHSKADGGGPIVLTSEREPVPTSLATPFPELGLGDLSGAVFDVESQDDASVSFRYSRNGVTIRKIFTLDEESYSFRIRIQVENGSAAPISPSFATYWPAASRGSEEFKDEAFIVLQQGKVMRHPLKGLGSAGFFRSIFGGGGAEDPDYPAEIDWAGIETTYFLAALLPDNPAQAQAKIATQERGAAGVLAVSFPAVSLPTGQVTAQEFRGYLGPKERPRLEAMGGETIRSINLGYSWIGPLVLGFGWLLRALYSIIPNYGVAIIVLTVMVRLVTMPLTNRQMRSMERMRELQPKLKELQAKHADDRQKQSEEMMKLYKNEGVNPLGGCFPMLLQLPVFIGLFYALRSSIELRQAPFAGWIDDLSAPETLFTIPGVDLPVRVLPLVMGVSMVAQQKLTPQTSMDPAQARMMMTVMPIMMTVLFYQFPSGLVLYWFVSNLLAIGHQLLIGRRMRGAR